MVKQAAGERRTGTRAKRILSIQYRLVKSKVKGQDTKWHLSTTNDMSVTGISFLSDVAYHLEDVLEVNVVMSGVLDIFKGYAKVVRLEKKTTGAYFLIAVKFIKGPSTDRRKTSPITKSKANRIIKK